MPAKTEQEMLDQIAGFGYMVAKVGDVFILADPLDDKNGFSLLMNSVPEIYQEWLNSGVCDGDRNDN